ncbi:MAG TPA: hypothetical protein VJ691_06835 [Vicinamibacterales bacterium]|nr:hypothetical protein [Vicinamibacterales bacterium]
MNLLLPVGAVLIAVGTAGSAAACYNNALFDGSETDTVASRMEDPTDAPAKESDGDDDSPRLFLAPLSGLTLAVGLICVGIGIGNWRRPVPTAVRSANPYGDQPKDSGEPPVGEV